MEIGSLKFLVVVGPGTEYLIPTTTAIPEEPLYRVYGGKAKVIRKSAASNVLTLIYTLAR
jgi:hypothetical protein